MTQISMDPEVMAVHVRKRGEAGGMLTSELNAIHFAVDCGQATDTVIAIVKRLGNAVDSLYPINGFLGDAGHEVGKAWKSVFG